MKNKLNHIFKKINFSILPEPIFKEHDVILTNKEISVISQTDGSTLILPKGSQVVIVYWTKHHKKERGIVEYSTSNIYECYLGDITIDDIEIISHQSNNHSIT